MDEIFNQILEYLSKENIPVIYFKYFKFSESSAKYFTELAIRVKTKDLAKWNYFNVVLNYRRETLLADVIIKKGVYKSTIVFKFRSMVSYNDKNLLIRDLNIFLAALQRKFYTVCPTKTKIHILIKPTYRCNLDCKYCFDKPHRERTKEDMSMEVLDRILYLASQTASKLYLSFHGGEPTMVGTEWYERAFVQVISKYPMLDFKFDFVSNGTNLDEKWFELFKKYNISFCVSYNANYQANLRCASQLNINEQRDIELGKKVEKVIREHDVGVVDVITKQNYKDMIKSYEFYKSVPGHHSFAMNVVNQNKQTQKNDLEMTPQEYATEFLKFFKYWLYDKDGIHERSCVAMLELVTGNTKGESVTCEYKDCRGDRFTINALGEIYECDKYLPQRYKAGTIFDIKHFDEIYKTNGYKLYSCEIDQRFNNTCSKCDYFSMCYGCCHASVIETAGDGKGIDEFACQSLKLKFNGVYEILREIDLNDSNINKYAMYYMQEYGFYSVENIRQILQKIDSNISLEYNPENLFQCSEYKIFSAINHESSSQDIGQALRKIKREGDFYQEETHTYFKQLIRRLVVMCGLQLINNESS